MQTRTIDNRRIWLVDGEYLFRGCPGQSRPDYLRIREWLERSGEIVQGCYVTAAPEPISSGQQRFHTWMKMARPEGPQLQVRLHTLKKQQVRCPECSSGFELARQNGVDVDLATLALTTIDRYDTLMLSAGDGDFLDTLEYIRNTRDKRLELVGFRGTVSANLQALADEMHWIDDVLGELIRPAQGGRIGEAPSGSGSRGAVADGIPAPGGRATPRPLGLGPTSRSSGERKEETRCLRNPAKPQRQIEGRSIRSFGSRFVARRSSSPCGQHHSHAGTVFEHGAESENRRMRQSPISHHLVMTMTSSWWRCTSPGIPLTTPSEPLWNGPLTSAIGACG